MGEILGNGRYSRVKRPKESTARASKRRTGGGKDGQTDRRTHLHFPFHASVLLESWARPSWARREVYTKHHNAQTCRAEMSWREKYYNNPQLYTSDGRYPKLHISVTSALRFCTASVDRTLPPPFPSSPSHGMLTGCWELDSDYFCGNGVRRARKYAKWHHHKPLRLEAPERLRVVTL